MTFFSLIYLQIMLFEKSMTSKLICKYRLFEIKNRDNLVKANLLLFTANFAINNLSI